MRTKSSVAAVRVGLTLDQSTQDRLNYVRENTEASSDSDVVRQALIYYEEFVSDLLSGSRFLFRNVDGEEVPIVLRDGASGQAKPSKRNLILHERSARRLDALRQTTDAPSDSELVREALRVYALIVENALTGNRLIKKDSNGNEREYIVPVSHPHMPAKMTFRILEKFGL